MYLIYTLDKTSIPFLCSKLSVCNVNLSLTINQKFKLFYIRNKISDIITFVIKFNNVILISSSVEITFLSPQNDTNILN